MGCCTGDREKDAVVNTEQKWEFINLDDFKSTSCWTPFAYGYLWVSLAISVSVYCVDTFTAVNLLVFDKWSGKISPYIPLRISRWIFAGCIILSFILLFYRWWRAIRVMNRSGVAQSYLDPLAVRIQSIRMGKEGRGWKRFLVFAELTKSRKGADYVALFAHYSFEAWLRIAFAEGPRQVLNALTLYSVMRLNLLPTGDHSATDGHTPIIQFFVNIGLLAQTNKETVVILFGMLFTLIVWVISVINLIIAVVLYFFFLFHHIPSTDGSLGKYCRRKINGRLAKIVKVKVDKALKKENEIRARQEARAHREGREVKRQPTIPDMEPDDGTMLNGLSRQTTMTTLPEYSSRPQTGHGSGGSKYSLDRQPTLPDMPDLGHMGDRPGPPGRTATHASEASWASYNSNAPLLNGAGEMGYGGPSQVQTPISPAPSGWSRPPPNRSMTGMSQSTQRTFTPGPLTRSGTASDDRSTPGTYQMEPLLRTRTDSSSSYHPRKPSGAEPSSAGSSDRQMPFSHGDSYFPATQTPSERRMPPLSTSVRSPVDSQGRQTPLSSVNPYFPPIPGPNDRNSPAPSMMNRSGTPGNAPPSRSYTPNNAPPPYRTMTPMGEPTLPRLQTSSPYQTSGYTAFSPEGPTNYSGRHAPQSSQSRYPPTRGESLAPQRHESMTMEDILNGY